MRVLVLGGTGIIGTAVVRELVVRGHDVIGLARSEASAPKLTRSGATPLAGDIAAPERWLSALPRLDAVIHMACDFATDMAAVDQRLLDAPLPALAAQPRRVRLVYTGGGWLLGATPEVAAAEASPFHPLPAFAWVLPHLQRVLAAPEADGIAIHPAMVYAGADGVFSRFAREAVERDAIRVIGSEAVRGWCIAMTLPCFTRWRSNARQGGEFCRRIRRGAFCRPHRARLRKALRHGQRGAGNHFTRHHRRRARRMGARLRARPAPERCKAQARTRLAARPSRSPARDRRASLTASYRRVITKSAAPPLFL